MGGGKNITQHTRKEEEEAKATPSARSSHPAPRQVHNKKQLILTQRPASSRCVLCVYSNTLSAGFCDKHQPTWLFCTDAVCSPVTFLEDARRVVTSPMSGITHGSSGGGGNNSRQEKE